MLAGYIAIWATDVNGCNVEAADDNDANDTPDNAEVTCAPTDDTSVATCAPSCDTQPDNPAKLTGGKLNCAIVEATDVAPA